MLAVVADQVGELIELIELEATIKLIACYAGQQIYIPKPESAWRVLRDERIRKDSPARIIGLWL